MKTKLFCELLELAISEQYGEESKFDTVPYIPEEGGPQQFCLGVFLLEGVHMGPVAARAQYILWKRMNEFEGSNEPEDEIDEAMGDFADLMGTMKIAPYMQWHCAYFPQLTQDQIDAEDDTDQPMVAPNPHQLFEVLQEARGTATWYSGRGMMGRSCPAITGSVSELSAAIASVAINHPRLVPYLSDFKTDNFGNDVVQYYPQFAKTEDDRIGHLPEVAQQVIIEMQEMAKIEAKDMAKPIAYVEAHPDEIVEWRENGMKISEIVDSVCALVI